jgi:integrase
MKRPVRFTDAFIRTLPKTGKRYDVREASKSGLTIRVGAGGSKVWQLQFRFDGKPWRMTIGSYPKVSLAVANVKAAEARQTLDLGNNPARETVEANRIARAAQTVSELADDYLSKWAVDGKRGRRSHKNIAEDRRIIEKDVRLVWGNRKARSIMRGDVAALLDEIKGRGAPVQANRTLTVLRAMFRKAEQRGIIDANPCAGMERPTTEERRRVFLDDETIRSFWLGLPTAKMIEVSRLVLRLVLVTAQRKGEVCEIEKADLELDRGTWFLPGRKVKNGRDHMVPLSPLAVDLLRRAWALSGDSRWLFPSRAGRGANPITGGALDHAMRNNRVALGLVDMDPHGGILEGVDASTVPTPHDLRRTAASNMTAAGIPRLHVDQLLNHVDGSVGATYDLHTYWPEKKRAVAAWEARLLEIVERREPGSNVVPMTGMGEAR